MTPKYLNKYIRELAKKNIKEKPKMVTKVYEVGENTKGEIKSHLEQMQNLEVSLKKIMLLTAESIGIKGPFKLNANLDYETEEPEEEVPTVEKVLKESKKVNK